MSIKDKSASIIGCGWFGYPLAKKLVANGWSVKGTTTSNEKLAVLTDGGIESFLLNFPSNGPIDPNLFHSHHLVLNIPPGRQRNAQLSYYSESIKKIVDGILKAGNLIEKIIFISSTSVYESNQDYIDENSPCNPSSESGRQILASEEIIRNAGIPHVILRFGGLAGPGRHPGKFLAGKKDLPIGHQSVNFLHLSDATEIAQYFLNSEICNEVFNVVSPMHPKKKDFYLSMASEIDEIPPTFSDISSGKKKEVMVDKFLKATGYMFKYPDPMKFEFNE